MVGNRLSGRIEEEKYQSYVKQSVITSFLIDSYKPDEVQVKLKSWS